MSTELTDLHSRPTAQQLLGSVARGMRLHGLIDARLSQSTRKNFERGDRVKPETRTDYVVALASVMVDLGFPRPRAVNDALSQAELVSYASHAIGEYCLAWDQCQTEFACYAKRGTDPLLTCLPMLRLALQDLGVRIGLHALAKYSGAAGSVREAGPSALVDGTAFIDFLRFQLRRRDMRRADLCAGVFGPTSYESWEAGGLPQSDNIEKLAEVLSRSPADRAQLNLELRVIIALVELWQWLAKVGMPEAHRVEFAKSLIDWSVNHAFAFAFGIEGTDAEKEDARLWGVLRGARHPPIGSGVGGLGRHAADNNFELDLHVLSSDWAPSILRWHGFLDQPIAAEDIRVGGRLQLPADWSDRDVVAWVLVSFHLELEPEPGVAEQSDQTSRAVEAQAERALSAGQFAVAEQISRSAIIEFGAEPWLHIKLAQALEGQWNLDAAEHEVLVAIVLDPSIQDAQLLRARILLAGGRFEQVLEALAAADELLPKNNPVIPEYEGCALCELGRLEDGVKAYVRSRTLNPHHVHAWAGEALTLARLGRFREAEKAAKQAAHLGSSEVLDRVRAMKRETARKRGR